MSLSATINKSFVNNVTLRGQKQGSVVASRNFAGLTTTSPYQQGGGNVLIHGQTGMGDDPVGLTPGGSYRTTGTRDGMVASLVATSASTSVLTAQLLDPGAGGAGLNGQVIQISPLAASDAIAVDNLNANRHYIEVVGGYGGMGNTVANAGDIIGFPTATIINSTDLTMNSPRIVLERRAPENNAANNGFISNVARAVYVMRVRQLPPVYEYQAP